jgi:hypothetical protein
MSTTTTNRITVEIVRSTDKAHFVKDAAGRTAWIQARWLRETDSTVSTATFERGAEKSSTRADRAAEAKAFRDVSHEILIARETDKAIASTVLLSTPGGFIHVTVTITPQGTVSVAREVIPPVLPFWLQQWANVRVCSWDSNWFEASPPGPPAYVPRRTAKSLVACCDRVWFYPGNLPIGEWSGEGFHKYYRRDFREKKP